MPVSVVSPSLKGVAPALRGLVRAVLVEEGLRPGEIAVVLTDDAALRDLNRSWRGIDRTTDVLSFSYGAPRRGMDRRARAAPIVAAVAGDVVISLDRVQEQARRYRVSRGKELARLVVHGALHLAGHNHHRAGERRIMRAREKRALRGARTWIRILDRHFARS